MKISASRVATSEDAKTIVEIANEHELSIDTNSSMFSEQGALDFIAGYIDPSPAYLISFENESGFSAVINLHPDSLKGRYFTDIYAKPHVKDLDFLVRWAIDLADSEHPEWQMWPGANFLDQRLQNAWKNHGYEFLRRYYTMRMSISSTNSNKQIQGLEIRTIDVSNPDHVALWHAAHQDAFSTHFGFVPRNFENWQELLLNEASLDHNGVFLAFLNGEPVGFCQCSDEYTEEKKGFINLLGVTHLHQGKGIGEALLRTGIAYYERRGFTSVELNVDTGNESGALRLYEKVGFKAESSWIQMSKPVGKIER